MFRVLALFWSPPTLSKNILLFSCNKLHYDHQLVSGFVCLLFGALQVVYSDLIRVLTATGNQVNEFVPWKTKTLN